MQYNNNNNNMSTLIMFEGVEAPKVLELLMCLEIDLFQRDEARLLRVQFPQSLVSSAKKALRSLPRLL